MTSHRSINPREDLESVRDSALISDRADVDAKSKTDLARQAELIATGQVPFPNDLPDGETERLRLEVVRRRRKQFIKLIARAIARDIQDGFHKTTGR